VAQSLRLLRTAHALVCMTPAGVAPATRAQLALAYDELVEAPQGARELGPWECLSLVAYDKIILVGAELAFVANCDDLFGLRAPALLSGERSDVPRASGLRVLEPDGEAHARFGALLAKNKAEARSLTDEDVLAELYGLSDWVRARRCVVAAPWGGLPAAGRDQEAGGGRPRGVRAYDYAGLEPWQTPPAHSGARPFADWWKIADRFVEECPPARESFYPAIADVSPLDADAAQLRLTRELRALLIGGKARPDGWPAACESGAGAGASLGPRLKGRKGKPGAGGDARRREADNVLERWLMALANAPGPAGSHEPWARVYRRSSPEDGFNNKLAGELLEKGLARSASEAGALVLAVLAAVERALGLAPRPSRARPTCAGGVARYGPAFEAGPLPRLARLEVLGGHERAVAVALRYAVVEADGGGRGGQQWGFAQAHFEFLYEEFGVRGEAFASPLNARLLGRPGARFCSLFPDTDAPFGSIGDFFAQDLRALGGNWVVNPPFVEELLARAARRVVEALAPDCPQTVFFVLPAWTDCEAYELLRGCAFLAAELRLDPGRYHFEDPAGRRVETKAASVYFALSTEGPQVRSRLAGALRHVLS
jgi:hypothetical protein